VDYQIRSLIKIGAGAFVNVDVFEGNMPDKNYIKGAIEWSIGDVTILNDSHWDIVDLLWLFILDGILEIRQREEAEVSFPSQPLLLYFSKIGSNQMRIKINDFTTVVDRSLVVRSLCEGGRVFFNRMAELLPQLRAKWEAGLQKIGKIESAFPLDGNFTSS
jgi:hypothetical protein